MILLFGDRSAAKSSASKKNSKVNNNPVENAGILAMTLGEAKSLLTVGEYDTYIFSNPAAIDYSMYSNCDFDSTSDNGFMGGFSAAVAMLGDSGFGGGSYSCAGAGSFSSGASCSSFSSVG